MEEAGEEGPRLANNTTRRRNGTSPFDHRALFNGTAEIPLNTSRISEHYSGTAGLLLTRAQKDNF